MTPPRRKHRGGAGGFEPKALIESRAQRAWELNAAGRSQREIAAELGISQAAVCKILRREADRLVEARQDDAERQRIRLLARQEHLFRESIRGFERSSKERTRKRQRQVTAADGAVTHTMDAEVMPRDGDPRFLEQAGRALDRAAALQGLTQDGGRTRATDERDPSGARDRLTGKLGRLALAGRAGALARKPE
jgi:predicted transcriptional regulator